MLRTIARAAALAIGLAAGGSSPAPAQQGDAAAVAVGTVPVERRAIARSLDVVGRIEATKRVEVRARVTGFLEAVEFTEGDVVKAGAPLYRIEPGLFEAAVKQAEGAVDRSKAAHQLAVIQLQRAQELLDRNAGTAVARDQARGAGGSRDGRPRLGRGQPPDGEDQPRLHRHRLADRRPDRPHERDEGQRRRARQRRADDDRQPGSDVRRVPGQPARVSAPRRGRHHDGSVGDQGAHPLRRRHRLPRDRAGSTSSTSPSTATTDTVLVRASDAQSRRRRCVDGQLVRVLLESGTPEEKVVVPQSALIADQGGVYVFVVEDGKAVVRRIKPGADSGADVVVDERAVRRRTGHRRGPAARASGQRGAGQSRRRGRPEGR